MEQTIKESDSYMSKEIVDQMLNNLLNETRTLKNNLPIFIKEKNTKLLQSFLEVENKKVPDIKLERDDVQIELVPHFKTNAFVIENPENTSDYLNPELLGSIITAMEVPQTIKREKVDLTTEPNVNLKTDTLDSMEIKMEPLKIEQHSYLPNHNHLDQKFNLTKEAEMIGNDDKYMFNSSLDNISSAISNQNGSEIKLEESKEMVNIENMEDIVRWEIKDEELNIKDEINPEDEQRRKASRWQQRKTREGRRSKKNSGGNFRCEQCDYQTVYKWNFKNHNIKHENSDKVDKFKCYHCEYQTIYKDYIKRHMKRHQNPADVDLYKCDQCHYQTVYKKLFKVHSLKHTNSNGVDVYKCDECDYQTVYKHNLKIHSVTHKNFKEVDLYKCNQCNYQTVYKQHLKRHSLIHDIYKC